MLATIVYRAPNVLPYFPATSLGTVQRLPASEGPIFPYLFDLYDAIRSPCDLFEWQTGFSPCSEGAGYRLPRRVEQGADDRRAVDLARVGVDPAVVHRAFGNDVKLLRFDPHVAQP